jgi:hypothetical protein
VIISEKEVHYLPNWSVQVAELVRTMWLGEDGRCYFPYPPLTTPGWWRDVARRDWAAGKMLSRFWVHEYDLERITATASIVDKGNYWEIGRFNAYPYPKNPRGIMSQLASSLYLVAKRAGYPVVCETTQCHTSSQFIVSELGMRFAGYGFLSEVDGVPWDILYFDNHSAPDFVSDQAGLIHNRFGVPTMALEFERRRLAEVARIISTEKTSGFPPRKFHIYSKYLPHLESILRMNVPALV